MDRVQLDELNIVDFRNIRRANLKPGARFNVVSGLNGSGKTNLIESIYLLGSLRSFRTRRREELIGRDAEAARVEGVFGQISAGMTLEMALSSEGRNVKIDGSNVLPGSRHFRNLPMVLFHPGNMELLQGGPEVRRRFVDRALFQAEAAYPDHHRAYGRALASRNRLLKERSPDLRALHPFDNQLAIIGEKIIGMRRSFVERISPLFSEAVRQISGGNVGVIGYRPKVDGKAADIEAALGRAFMRDVARGFTSTGPHGDDLTFEVDGLDARKFASQGQQRTVVLAAKIAETRGLEASSGRTPLLLLDDVSSELDRDRNRQLFDFLSGVGGQVFITTTHSDHIVVDEDRVDFSVSNGKVVPV